MKRMDKNTILMEFTIIFLISAILFDYDKDLENALFINTLLSSFLLY